MREVPDWQVFVVIGLLLITLVLPICRRLGIERNLAVVIALAAAALAAIGWSAVLRWNEREWQRSIEAAGSRPRSPDGEDGS